MMHMMGKGVRKPPIEVVEDHKSSANFPIAPGCRNIINQR
jgi:hypothetical protein